MTQGVTNKKSSTAKKLFDQITFTDSNNKFVKILLSEDLIKEIHLKNMTMSTVVQIAISILEHFLTRIRQF